MVVPGVAMATREFFMPPEADTPKATLQGESAWTTHANKKPQLGLGCPKRKDSTKPSPLATPTPLSRPTQPGDSNYKMAGVKEQSGGPVGSVSECVGSQHTFARSRDMLCVT